MRRSRLHERLSEGRQVAGVFAPAGADFATPGSLSWSVERGAELELVDLTDPWPTDFDESFTVHGSPHEGEDITLFDTRVRTVNLGSRTSRVGSWTLGLGAHALPEDRWPWANICPAHLHEWLPETGLTINHPDEDRSRVVVEWRSPERREIPVPGGVVTLLPGVDYAWAYTPDWRIDTSMTFGIKPDTALTIDEFRKQFRNPLLAFIVFAADRPDDLTHESYHDAAQERSIVVMRREHVATRRDWRVIDGDLLFRSHDLPDIAAALQSWFAVWHASVPSLGLFREVIQEGNTFSAPRFLTLYTAAEGYWRNTETSDATWNVRALAKRAAVAAKTTGATKNALALIGAARQYHAHLRLGSQFSPEEIAETTYESTRRLHALMQACLLRELGLETSEIERLLIQHYRTWPLP